MWRVGWGTDMCLPKGAMVFTREVGKKIVNQPFQCHKRLVTSNVYLFWVPIISIVHNTAENIHVKETPADIRRRSVSRASSFAPFLLSCVAFTSRSFLSLLHLYRSDDRFENTAAMIVTTTLKHASVVMKHLLCMCLSGCMCVWLAGAGDFFCILPRKVPNGLCGSRSLLFNASS
jgi:hypothetical protein